MSPTCSASDRLAFTVSQPLRPDQATVEMVVPREVDGEGRIRQETVRADISPDGRETDLQLVYRRQMSDNGVSFGVGAFARLEPDHRADADTEWGGGLKVALPLWSGD